MIRSTRLALLFPFALAAACGDDTTLNAAGDGGGAATGADGGGTATADVTPPSVTSSYPGTTDAAGTGVATTTTVVATFSEAMGEASVVTAFSLANGGVVIPSSVTYFEGTATLSPTASLALATTYTATITTAASDVAGNALGAAYTWSFTTDATAPLGPSPLVLGTASNYAVLAKSAITNVPTSKVTGNIGISPAAASYITGFAMTKAGMKWTAPEVIGGIFAADNDPPTPTKLTTAIGDMMAAYTDGETRPNPTFLDRDTGILTSTPLRPGLYKWGSAVTIPVDINLVGAANDVWIFQITGDLTMSAATSMLLSGGARPKNVFWQVAGVVDLGTTSHAEGIVLSKTAIKLGTGASINGRLLAQTAVTLASNTVTVPAL